MATISAVPNAVSPSADRIPWYVWCSVAAVTSAMIGVHWDISWHRSIGRDTFWTPPHLAIHLCGVLAGIACGYLILDTTFRRDSPLRPASVSLWGFHGPLGAFIAAWGGICMISSAPFDNWWHNAYGLDVKILSPPHAVLAVGIFAVQFGVLVLILSHMNRAEGALRLRLRALFLYVAGMLLIALTVFQLELTYRSHMHTVKFYRVLAITVPLVLTRVWRATDYKWAATAVAAVYTAFLALFVWILPLFPAEPKLGPVYIHVTQFVPPEFPLLLIVPAFALDLMWNRTGNWPRWRQAIVSAAVFLGVLAAVQWPFATFLMSLPARNRFFGTIYFEYFTHPASVYVNYRFFKLESGSDLWFEILLAMTFGAVTSWIGLAGGDWMRRIRR